jgi:N-acetylneuraminate synthase
MIMSTGMADLDEIEEAVDCARDAGCKDLALLHCVSGYPAPASDYNLKTLVDLHSRYGLVTGLSDHTLENTTAIAAVALGASIIEKHMTLDRSAGGPDDSFSLEPAEFADLCTSARTAWSALGKIDYTRKSSEVENVKFRRSLYFVEPLPEGAIITKQSVRSVRPGYGAAPKFLDEIIGKRVKSAVQENTPVDLENIDWQ